MYPIAVVSPLWAAVRKPSWFCAGLIAAAFLTVPVLHACSWSFLIWGLRGRSPDPLLRFVKAGKAGYINQQGRIVIDAILPAQDNASGEFHEGLMGIHEGNAFRYIDRTGNTTFTSDAWLAFGFSEGFAPRQNILVLPRTNSRSMAS